jgi:hypothetical protein
LCAIAKLESHLVVGCWIMLGTVRLLAAPVVWLLAPLPALLICTAALFVPPLPCSAKLESLVGALLERTKAPCMQCMKDAGEEDMGQGGCNQQQGQSWQAGDCLL